MALRDAHKTRNGRDVDDGTGPAVCTLSRLLQKGQEGGAEEERCDDVCGVEVAPVLETMMEISPTSVEWDDKILRILIEEVLLHLLGVLAVRSELASVDAGVYG
jgi:hypothetical protein